MARKEMMSKLINFAEYPISVCLAQLLKDQTTKKNIIFATDIYTGEAKDEIKKKYVLSNKGHDICPRVEKSEALQSDRTRKKAEVFTPSWICNKMNNHCDEEWFGRKDVFNKEDGQTWKESENIITFSEEDEWKKYVTSRRLEITCGEAPYIVSRYDASTGEIIPISRRIGILDRKMRVINENTKSEAEWFEWTYKAYQSVYGYEFQGDNLLIARANLLVTFVDYISDRFGRDATEPELKKLAKIITWNFWQMDGITGTIPFGKPKEENHQISFWDYAQGINDTEPEEVDCKIYDWTANKEITYRSLKGE